MLQLVLIVKCKFLIREMSMYSSEDSSSKVRVSGSNWCRLNSPQMSRQVFLYGKLRRWFPRDSALNWKLLEASRNSQVLYREQGTILSPLGTTVTSAKLDFWVSVSWLLFDNGTWHGWPDSCRHFSSGQQVFYNLEFAALQLLNTLRTGSFKLFKHPFPGFLTILTL